MSEIQSIAVGETLVKKISDGVVSQTLRLLKEDTDTASKRCFFSPTEKPVWWSRHIKYPSLIHHKDFYEIIHFHGGDSHLLEGGLLSIYKNACNVDTERGKQYLHDSIVYAPILVSLNIKIREHIATYVIRSLKKSVLV